MAFSLLNTQPRIALANHYTFGRGEVVGPHYSETDLYLLVNKGCGRVDIGAQQFAVSEGMALHANWAAPIRYTADASDPFLLMGIHFVYRRWDECSEVKAPHHRIPVTELGRVQMLRPPSAQPCDGPCALTPPPDSPLFEHAERIIAAYADRRDASAEIRCRVLSLQFIIEWESCAGNLNTAIPHPRHVAIGELTAWIGQNFARQISRQDLARRVNMSQTSLVHAFLASTGCTPIQYLINVRMSRARQLLAGTTDSVGEIAARVGIPDVYYFSKLFKKRHGSSPKAYRNGQRQPMKSLVPTPRRARSAISA